MATQTTISALTALGAAPATNDLLVLVDVSDPTQAASGTTKTMTVANLFTTPTFTGTTTLAATNISGDIAVNTNKVTIAAASGNTVIAGTLNLTGVGTFAAGIALTGGTAAAGTIVKAAASGLLLNGVTGSVNDFQVNNAAGTNAIIANPTGTNKITLIDTLTVSGGGVTVTGNSTITGTLSGLTGLTVASGGATITSGGVTITAGKLTTAATTTGTAGLNLPGGTAPASPVNGDLWFDGTNVRIQVSGVTKTFTLT